MHDGGVLSLTLDTSCVIHGAQSQSEADSVEVLVALARQGEVGLWLAEAFEADLERASDAHRRANLVWLQSRPVARNVPGPFRLDYSVLDGRDVLVDESTARVAQIVEEIVLPANLRVGRLDSADRGATARWRRRINDVQHLLAHHMSGHDAFVTTDHDDIIRNATLLHDRAGIRVLSPQQAVAFVVQR
jgi:hypothetical protein